MESTKFISTLLIAFLISITSCQRDDGNFSNQQQQQQQQIIPDSFSEYFGNEISRDFLGTVIDKNHLPIEGVIITIGNETALTDSNGVFIIRDADINQRFGYIKAEKAGYIHGSRSVVPSEGTNKVNIMLLEANVVATINSGSSEAVSLSNGSSVSFDGNFIKEDGSAYSGSVDVIMHHLDPTDDDMVMQMPGMLYAQNEDGAERMLQTLGMLAVKLRGTNGEDLNLAEGSTSEIKIPIDVSLMSIAPASIPLWYFDESNGYWKEEGVATLQGNMYVGTVSHFSFWNYDIPAETITLCVTVTDENNNNLSNLLYYITSTTLGTRGGYTNENGEICGYTPSNESFVIHVYSYDLCGDGSLYTETVGPFSADASISIILPVDSNIITETITGNFNTCNGDAVTDGYVQVSYGGQTFTEAVTDGTIEFNMLRCDNDNTFSITGYDFVNFQETGLINYTFTTPNTYIGVLNACNAVDEFIYYNRDNGEIETTFYPDVGIISFEPFNVDFNAPVITINIISPGCLTLTMVLDNNNLLGAYDHYVYSAWNSLFTGDTGGALIDPSYSSSYCGHDYFPEQGNNEIMTYNVNAIGNNVGDYIDISFSGSYLGGDSFTPNGLIHTINGVIHVKRRQ